MNRDIQESHFWVFSQLYAILANFADLPERVIGRIGRGTISIPDDQAEELYQHRRTIVSNYPNLTDLEIMRITEKIEAILDRHGADDSFWSNNGFIRHDDWLNIREMARAFLIR